MVLRFDLALSALVGRGAVAKSTVTAGVLAVLWGFAGPVMAMPVADASEARGKPLAPPVLIDSFDPYDVWSPAIAKPAVADGLGSPGDLALRIDELPEIRAVRAAAAPSLELDDTADKSARPPANTLRQVLRAMVTMHRAPSVAARQANQPPGAARSLVRDEDDGTVSSESLADILLDSRYAGEALLAFIDVGSPDNQIKTFSVFGIGEFALETSPIGESLTLSELSSGWSASLSRPTGPGYVEYGPASSGASGPGGRPVAAQNTLRNIIAIIIEYLTDPLVVILEAFAGGLFLLWIAVRFVVHLERRETRSRYG